jgi:hypothetical protein
LTALTTARGVMVAPAIWSKTPPSFFTAHFAAGSVASDRPLNDRIHGDFAKIDLVAQTGGFVVLEDTCAEQHAGAVDANQHQHIAGVAARRGLENGRGDLALRRAR